MTNILNQQKIPIGILGATGVVGQRFISLLENHPWFETKCVAASSRSAGKIYKDAVKNRWVLSSKIPELVSKLRVFEVESDRQKIANSVKFVFSALNLGKDEIRKIENTYASMGIPVISNNSAHRWTEDVPMIIPEINPQHVELIDIQRKNRNWKGGFITVKPNCSIQSYIPVIEAWKKYYPEKIIVSTYQALSGAGKTFTNWPEMKDNVIPLIPGEEKKSEDEPMKIWGKIINGKLQLATIPKISATCIRVPVTDGHLASVSIEFKTKPKKEDLIDAIVNFENPIQNLNLPFSPKIFLQYFEEENRPQTLLDRNLENGMGIGVGRIREDPVLQWKFVALSHNTIRGAAGGAILMAEMLVKKGYIK